MAVLQIFILLSNSMYSNYTASQQIEVTLTTITDQFAKIFDSSINLLNKSTYTVTDKVPIIAYMTVTLQSLFI